MNHFEIVAHRGVPSEAPENTMASFERAIALGADAIELDVRLTADGVPIVYHYYYLEVATSFRGPVFKYTLGQLQQARVLTRSGDGAGEGRIPTLNEVLETLGGRIGLEIEIKGPEREAPQIVGAVLRNHRHLWATIEVTSYEPALLLGLQQLCPGLATDLLFPRSEPWMGLDVVTYSAIHHARLARARAVHLHVTQLSAEVVADVRQHGIEVHAWEINDEHSLRLAAELGIPRICTDRLRQALEFRLAPDR